jgi:energy-coupling factor transporter ATP-binding protein EcfA2
VTTLSLFVLGSLIEVTIVGLDEAQTREVEQSWQWCLAAGDDALQAPATRLVFSVGDASPVGDSRSYRDFETFASDLAGFVTRAAIDAADSKWMLVHAAAIAHPQTGEVIAFIGASGAGKSTLAKALAADYVYVTDETLAVDLATGEVLAYPKPISMFSNGPGSPKKQVGPAQLGFEQAAQPLRLRQVFLLDRQIEPAGMPQTKSITTLRAVEKLVPQVSYLPRRANPISDMVRLAEWGSGIEVLTYSEAADLVAFVEIQFEAGKSEPQLDKQSAWVRTGPNAAMTSGEEVILLVDGRVVALEGIAAAIWLGHSRGDSAIEVIDQLVRDYGSPLTGGVQDRFYEICAELEARGIATFSVRD